MTTQSMNIPGDVMQQVVAKAILESLGEDNRNVLLQGAIEHLLTQPKNSYGRAEGNAPIQDFFNSAVRNAAQEVVKELLEEPEMKETLRTHIREAVTKGLADSGYVSGAIGIAVGDAVGKLLRDAN